MIIRPPKELKMHVIVATGLGELPILTHLSCNIAFTCSLLCQLPMTRNKQSAGASMLLMCTGLLHRVFEPVMSAQICTEHLHAAAS